MPSLNTKPGSSSKRQHQTLVVAARGQGFELAEIRKTVGGSIHKLSAAKCSDWIKHYSGNGLANPPGQKPSPYKGKKRTGATRMITQDQIDQIRRLGARYFGTHQPFSVWLTKDFKVTYQGCHSDAAVRAQIRELGTAERAGQVIRVLKEMLARRAQKETQ